MRPVDLTPPEQRRGSSAPNRTGALAYVLVAALAVVLVCVVATVVFSNRVTEKENEITQLEAQATELTARAESLSVFTRFQQIHDARVQTVSDLATSRFDWQRVLEELSRVLPRRVWLTELTGTVSPAVQVGEGDASGLRESVEGPALVLVGCGRSQNAVAKLVAAMRDIDGVTRVTASSSAKLESANGQDGDSCQTRPSIPQFNLVAAFDAVVVEASAPPPAVTATPETATTASNDGGVGQAQAQAEDTQAEVGEADAKTDKATDLLPSGG